MLGVITTPFWLTALLCYSSAMDARTALEQFQDHLAPQLDVYEQAVYLYALRHSRLVGKPNVTIELKDVQHKIAKGLGRRGSRLTPQTCLNKLKSLDAKGCVELAASNRRSVDIHVLLPSEMPDVVTGEAPAVAPDLDGVDFVTVAENRRRILKRDDGRCFYCRKKINESNSVIDRASPRPAGDNGYRNAVAACRRCSNRKGESAGEDLLRVLFREGFITSDLLSDRLKALQDLRAGRLAPPS